VNVFAIRHGETEWSLSGKHTGTTDIPLTDRGRRLAERMRPILGRNFSGLALCSPMQRARETCELAGFGQNMIVDPDLVEWNYGDYEGRTTKEIRAERPGWQLFRDGCPGGETVEQVAARADRVIKRLRQVPGDVLVFSSGHFIRVLAERWIGLGVSAAARSFMLSTASLSALGYENDLDQPVIRFWNDTSHTEIAQSAAAN